MPVGSTEPRVPGGPEHWRTGALLWCCGSREPRARDGECRCRSPRVSPCRRDPGWGDPFLALQVVRGLVERERDVGHKGSLPLLGRAAGGIGFSGVSPSGSRAARAGGRRRPTGPSNHRFSRLSCLLAAVSTSVFIVAILILLLLLYHRDPMCCQFLCSCRLFQTPSQYVSVLQVFPLFLLPTSPPLSPELLFPCAGSVGLHCWITVLQPGWDC